MFIKSTAGMRLLPVETQEAIYDSIYTALGESNICDIYDWIESPTNRSLTHSTCLEARQF